jgi:hypothetical protein
LLPDLRGDSQILSRPRQLASRTGAVNLFCFFSADPRISPCRSAQHAGRRARQKMGPAIRGRGRLPRMSSKRRTADTRDQGPGGAFDFRSSPPDEHYWTSDKSPRPKTASWWGVAYSCGRPRDTVHPHHRREYSSGCSLVALRVCGTLTTTARASLGTGKHSQTNGHNQPESFRPSRVT